MTGVQTCALPILQMAGWEQQAGEGLYLARERHLQALRRVQQHMQQAQAHLPPPIAGVPAALDLLAEELRLAQGALGQITGAFDADDLLGAIFSRFCIGK